VEVWAEEKWGRVIRFRLGNEVREGWYWEKVEKRGCRICGREELWERCMRGREWEEVGWQEVVGKVLREERKGEEWMKEIQKLRKEVESEERKKEE